MNKEKTKMDTFQVKYSPELIARYPGAHAGFLAVADFRPMDDSAALDAAVQILLAPLRAAAPDSATLRAHPAAQAYARYLRPFNKTYPVLAQAESILFGGRVLPTVFPLLALVFAAELGHLLLTAVHDLDALRFPLRVDVASGEESYTTLRGVEQPLKRGDMLMADASGIISSIVYGPDARTRVSAATTSALAAVYAPEGLAPAAVDAMLGSLQAALTSLCPQARFPYKAILPRD